MYISHFASFSGIAALIQSSAFYTSLFIHLFEKFLSFLYIVNIQAVSKSGSRLEHRKILLYWHNT